MVFLALCSKQLSSSPHSVIRIISRDDMRVFELTHMYVEELKRLLLSDKILEKSENCRFFFFFTPKFNYLYTVDKAQNCFSKKEIKNVAGCFSNR